MSDRRAAEHLKQLHQVKALSALRARHAVELAALARQRTDAAGQRHEAAVEALQSGEQAWHAALQESGLGLALASGWAADLLRLDAAQKEGASALTEARDAQQVADEALSRANARNEAWRIVTHRAERKAERRQDERLLTMASDGPSVRRDG